MAVSVKAGAKFEFTAPTASFETQAHEPITAEEFFTYVQIARRVSYYPRVWALPVRPSSEAVQHRFFATLSQFENCPHPINTAL